MKCPYTVNTTQYAQTTYEHDSITSESTMSLEFRPFVECLKDGCAAWQDGRCQYKGAVP